MRSLVRRWTQASLAWICLWLASSSSSEGSRDGDTAFCGVELSVTLGAAHAMGGGAVEIPEEGRRTPGWAGETGDGMLGGGVGDGAGRLERTGRAGAAWGDVRTRDHTRAKVARGWKRRGESRTPRNRRAA